MPTSNSRWPDDSRCCVLVTLNFDAESVDLHEVPREDLFGRFSYGRYGMRAGVWRLLDMLEARGVPATFFVPALDAENNVRQVKSIAAAGHEIAARGYAYEDHSQLGAREREILQRAHDALTKAAGKPPAGWRAPMGLLSADTLELLCELGYGYDSSFQDDDYPYVMECSRGKLVELPSFQMLDDSTLYAPRHSSIRVLKTWKEEFDAMYEAGTLITLTLHVRGEYGSGRAVRAAAAGEFIAYMQARSGVCFMTCAELAAWWRQNHPQSEPAPAYQL